MNYKELAQRIRRDCLLLTNKEKGSHIGSMFSAIDVFSVLFSRVFNYNENRDRFVLSKGHALPAVYASLFELNKIKKEQFENYYKNKDLNKKAYAFFKHNNFVDFSSTSLGHGVGVAVGIALAGKIDNKDYKTYVMVGNGELNEGSVWEAFMLASHLKLNNLTVIVDDNEMQAMGKSDEIIDMLSIEEKLKSFGALVLCVDGHNYGEIENALLCESKDRFKVIVAKTVKGKGVSFIERNSKYHYDHVTDELIERALFEVDNNA